MRRGERCRVFLHSTGGGGSSLALHANKIPEHRCHMITLGEGWDLPSADPAEQEGLCQLSGDVMIYFEEVMSGLCSEAGGVYSGTTLVQLSRTTKVDLNRHFYKIIFCMLHICILQLHQFERMQYVCQILCA